MNRTFTFLALVAIVFAGFLSSMTVQAQNSPATVQAQGNPYLVDFMALSNKRADLRGNVVSKGLNTAFSDWLRVTHASAYRDALAHGTGTTQVISSRSTQSCCVHGKVCCSLCPKCCTKRQCTLNCCDMKACASLPNCCS